MESFDLNWWAQPEPADTIWKIIGSLEKRYAPTHERWLRYLRLYSDGKVSSLSPDDFLEALSAEDIPARKNVVRSLIQTVLNKTLRSRSRVVQLPRGADPEQRELAELITDFTDGLFRQGKLRKMPHELTVLSALIWGPGIWRTAWASRADGKTADIVNQRVLPWTFFYDPLECQDGAAPRCVYHTRLVPRETLQRDFPKRAGLFGDALGTARSPTDTSATRGATATDMVPDRVRVCEAWRLPTRKGARDGKYAAVVRTGCFDERAYVHDQYPFSCVQWQPNVVGWWLEADSLAKEAESMQIGLDETNEKVRSGMRAAPAFVMNPAGSKVPRGAITNRLGLPVLDVEGGVAPTVVHGQPTHPQYLQIERTDISDAYDFTGVSQAAASARKPSGITAGVALQTLADQDSERFLRWHERDADLFEETAAAQMRAAYDAAQEGYNVESFARRNGSEVRLDFKGLKLGGDLSEYPFSSQVMSNLPADIAGQLELATSLVAQGALPREIALDLVTGLPDVEAARRIQQAPVRAVELDVSAIINKGELRLPDKYDNLQYAINYGQAQYLMLRRLPEVTDDKARSDQLLERRELLSRYIDAALAEVAAQQAAMAAEMQPEVNPNGAEQLPPGIPAGPAGPAGVPISDAAGGPVPIAA